mgnify:CR=1 FL=1
MLTIKENEIPKIIIKKLFDNYAIITESYNKNIIYNYENNMTVYKFQTDIIVSMNVNFIDNQIILYALEIKESRRKDLNQTLMKKYLIKRNWKGEEYDFNINLMNSQELQVHLNKNYVKNMIVVNDDKKEEKDKNGSDVNLIFFSDDIGNIFYKYY